MKRFALVVLLVGGCGGGSKTPDAMPLPTIDAHPPDAAPHTAAVFQPAAPGNGQAWGAVPYPSDLYLDGAGLLALTTLPVGPAPDPAAITAMADTLHTMDGAGTWSSVYFPIAGDVDETTLAGHVHLALLPAGGGLGAELPVDLVWRGDLHMIVAVPVLGTTLREATPYGAWVDDAVHGADGTPVSRATGFDPATEPSLTALAQALPAATLSHVVTATVFHTEHVTRGLAAMRAVVTATPPVVTAIDQIFSTPAELDGLFGVQDPAAVPGGDDSGAPVHRPQPHGHVAAVLHGHLNLANFLSASQTVAGFPSFDAAGVPAVQSQSSVKFTLVLPKTTPASFANLPVIIYVHGINETREDLMYVADTAAAHGMATLGIDLLYHGDRQFGTVTDAMNGITGAAGPDGFAEGMGLLPATHFFQLSPSGGIPQYHPRAMRENLRQAAADVCSLVSFLRSGDLALVNGALAPVGLPADLSFRPGVAVVTESFGALVTGVALAVEPGIGAAVLSSAAAGFPYPAMVHSPSFSGTFIGIITAPYDLSARIVIGDAKLDPRFDPLVMLYDSALEEGDPVAYAPYVADGSVRGDLGPNLLMGEVYKDETVSNDSTEHLAGIYGVPRVPFTAAPMQPPDPPNRWVVLPTAAAPLMGDAAGGQRTRALGVWHPSTHPFLRLYKGQHRLATDLFPFTPLPMPVVIDPLPIAQLHAQWARFLSDYFAGAVPTVIDPYVP